MKLLLDENLAARLVRDLADIYPESAHVSTLGLGGAADRAIWDRAAADGFVLATKDEDFHRLSVLFDSPTRHPAFGTAPPSPPSGGHFGPGGLGSRYEERIEPAPDRWQTERRPGLLLPQCLHWVGLQGAPGGSRAARRFRDT